MSDEVIGLDWASRLASGKQRIAEISNDIKLEKTFTVSVRTLIGWFGFKKRGSWMARHIGAILKEYGITTDPDFMGAYIDSDINLKAIDEEVKESICIEEFIDDENDAVEYLSGITSDPAFRISRLKSANIQPVYVNPMASINEAITLMMTNDFDQLPVMQNSREVKGVISWQSIGINVQLGLKTGIVKDYMDDYYEVKDSVSIFNAIPLIMRHDCVLVRDKSREVCGIVTPSDLNQQFLDLSESFLLVGEIENQIRRIMDGKFTIDEIRKFRDAGDTREVNSISDLTFGEYVRLLQNEESWNKIGLNLDRKIFTDKLDVVRIIRNNVMHFDPDGLDVTEIATLREFSSFLRKSFIAIEKITQN